MLQNWYILVKLLKDLDFSNKVIGNNRIILIVFYLNAIYPNGLQCDCFNIDTFLFIATLTTSLCFLDSFWKKVAIVFFANKSLCFVQNSSCFLLFLQRSYYNRSKGTICPFFLDYIFVNFHWLLLCTTLEWFAGAKIRAALWLEALHLSLASALLNNQPRNRPHSSRSEKGRQRADSSHSHSSEKGSRKS